MYYILLVLFVLAAGLVLRLLMRRTSVKSVFQPVPRLEPKGFAVVSGENAGNDPYPYIYVNADGTSRELHGNEGNYLETPFQGSDGGRPYIKSSFEQKDGWGETKGFLERTRLPKGAKVFPAPSEDPEKKMTRYDQIQFLHEKGFEVVHNSDGTFTATKRKTQKPELP